MGASVSSLNEYFSKGLSGFFSYSREDDEDFNEVLSKFRTAIQSELAAQLGRKRDNFSLWQDKFAIPHGALWQKTIAQAINQSAFFIPIITPRVVASPHCAFEFESFLAREQELGRDDLVFPILYIRVRELDDGTWQQNPVLKIVKDRQYLDWRDYRTRKPSDQDVQDKIIEFCGNIANALLKPWESMAERRQRQEEAERIAEQQQHRKTAEIAAARLAEEERQRREAEAEAKEAETVRRAEAERQRAAEAEAVRLAEAERQKAAEAARLAEVERQRAVEAEAARLAQADRQRAAEAEAEDRKAAAAVPAAAPAAGPGIAPVSLFKAPAVKFGWPPSRPAMVAAGAVAAVLLVGILVWIEKGQSSSNRVASATPSSSAPIATSPSPVLPPAHQSPSNTSAAPATRPISVPQPQNPTAPAQVTANAAPDAGALPQGPGGILASPPPSPATTAGPPPSMVKKYAACSPRGGTQTANFIGGPPAPLTLKLTATPREVRTIAVSPDGTRLVSAGDDAIIRVWDAASLRWIGNITGHSKEVYSVAFSDDGKLLASASWDGTVRVWDARTFSSHPLHVFSASGATGPIKQWSVAFEPGADPHYVDAAADDGNVWIWNIANDSLGTKRPSGDQPVRSLSFAPRGNGEFATADFDGKVRFFADSGRIPAVTAGTGKALHVAYSPNGDLVASAAVDSSGKGVKVWSVSSHTLSKTYQGHKGYANAVAWSRDGNTIVSGGGAVDKTVRLWDVQSANQLRVLTGHTADVEAVAFHPNQKWLISAGEDGTMKIWDIAGANELLSMVGFDNGDYLAYAPSGCYTGTADAANYVTYIDADKSDTHDNGKDRMFVPDDATALLLPQ